MRIIRVFGQHIDMEPIVQISDCFLPKEIIPENSGELHELIEWTPRPLGKHLIRVCEIAYLLRDGRSVLYAPWPNINSYFRGAESRDADERAYQGAQREALRGARADYELLIHRWANNRPNFSEIARG